MGFVEVRKLLVCLALRFPALLQLLIQEQVEVVSGEPPRNQDRVESLGSTQLPKVGYNCWFQAVPHAMANNSWVPAHVDSWLSFMVSASGHVISTH